MILPDAELCARIPFTTRHGLLYSSYPRCFVISPLHGHVPWYQGLLPIMFLFFEKLSCLAVFLASANDSMMIRNRILAFHQKLCISAIIIAILRERIHSEFIGVLFLGIPLYMEGILVSIRCSWFTRHFGLLRRSWFMTWALWTWHTVCVNGWHFGHSISAYKSTSPRSITHRLSFSHLSMTAWPLMDLRVGLLIFPTCDMLVSVGFRETFWSLLRWHFRPCCLFLPVQPASSMHGWHFGLHLGVPVYIIFIFCISGLVEKGEEGGWERWGRCWNAYIHRKVILLRRFPFCWRREWR